MNKKIIILLILLCLLGVFGLKIEKIQALTEGQLKTLEEIQRSAVADEVKEWMYRVNTAEDTLRAWERSELEQARTLVANTQVLAQVMREAPKDSEQKKAAQAALEGAQQALQNAELARGALVNYWEVTQSALSVLISYSLSLTGLYGLDPQNLTPFEQKRLTWQTNKIKAEQERVTETQISVDNICSVAYQSYEDAAELYNIADTAGDYQIIDQLNTQITESTDITRIVSTEVSYQAAGGRIAETMAGARGARMVSLPAGSPVPVTISFLGKEIKTPGESVSALFVFGLSLVGILALVVMVAGGILYLASAGNPGRIATAKSLIIGALTGLALLFCSYIILKLINPDLVRLKELL